MSAQDILAELPRLSLSERVLIAKALHDLETSRPPLGQPRQVGMHAGAWLVTADFDAPLPDAFWLGEDA